MLARAHRFHGLGSLTFAYKRGQSIRGQYFASKYTINQRRTTYRVAVVVSKKVSKLAVERNCIRRTIFEAVRLAGIPESKNIDLIISVHNAAISGLTHDQLTAQVRGQLSRAGII